jgi:hypothetical protein
LERVFGKPRIFFRVEDWDKAASITVGAFPRRSNSSRGQMNFTSDSSWSTVASLYDEKVAQTLASLLEAEAVPTRVAADPMLIGEALVWEVRVPLAMFERAMELLTKSHYSDAELEFLATGNLSGAGGAK